MKVLNSKANNFLLWLFCVFIPALPALAKTTLLPVAEYEEKVYASWLAQVIGNIYGLNHENRYIDEPGPDRFPYGYMHNTRSLRETNGAFSDDDTDIEYMYLLAMEKYGPEPSYTQLTQSWLYHVRERVWLANRAALGAMHHGFTPPVTGMRQVNPHWFQIDPQLVNEIWAVTAPGMVGYAVEKSNWAARITNDGEGCEATMHYGAMYAAAFFESDVNRLIDIGVEALPRNSRFAKTVAHMKSLYRTYPHNWEAARQDLAEAYYHNESPDRKTIWNANLNGACGILALLYGQGDYQKTLDLACAMGFDADNQAATMSGLLGIIVGLEGLPREWLFPFPDLNWEKPFNDLYKNRSRYDMPDASLVDMARRMALQGEKIILRHGGKKIMKDGVAHYQVNRDARFIAPLELPNAPLPYIEVGRALSHEFILTGGMPPYQWDIVSGQIPAGLRFADGRLTGIAKKPGIYPIVLRVTSGDAQVDQRYNLVVRGINLAPVAQRIISNVTAVVTSVRDNMHLTVPPSLYAESISVIRDGRRLGDGSTFYSIGGCYMPKIDTYGYLWEGIREIGLIGYHVGALEETGGWFTDGVTAEYLDDRNNWKAVANLVIVPEMPRGDAPFNKAHFVEYLLAFEPVRTRGIRISGNAGSARRRGKPRSYFTSISELTVHGALPGYHRLGKSTP